MQIQETYNQIQELLSSSNKILLMTRREPNPDGVGALLALSAFIKARRQNQELNLVAEGLNKNRYRYLPNIDSIQTNLPPQNLVIAIDLTDSPVEKINYETKGERLELVITPQKGVIDPSGVQFVQKGLTADLVITLDAQNLDALGQTAQTYQETLSSLPLINIDNHQNNSLYGKINWIDSGKVSLTQMIWEFLSQNNLDISAEMALDVLVGVYFRTHGFRKDVSPEIFQTAAQLLRQGADYQVVTQNVQVAPLPKAAGSMPAVLENERAQAYIR